MKRSALRAVSPAAVLSLAACSSFGRDDLPPKPPPLADMEEPVALHEEPRDEAARRALPAGSFTGLTVVEARRTLDEAEPSEGGVRVSRVVENSPADAAGIEEDDLLLAVRRPGSPEAEIRWPSEWRKIEIDTPPGTTLSAVIDRAGEERPVELQTVARVRSGERTPGERFREDRRVGVVLRTATEVEARANGLGPGAGAVIVGLSAGSPWRAAGMRFGDLLVSVGGAPVAHPQIVLDAIRASKDGEPLAVGYVRDGYSLEAALPSTHRAKELRRMSIPFVWSYESERGITETSLFAGLFRKRTTEAAWEWRLFWLIDVSGGDADRLVEAGK